MNCTWYWALKPDQNPETNNLLDALILHFWYLEYAAAALFRTLSVSKEMFFTLDATDKEGLLPTDFQR